MLKKDRLCKYRCMIKRFLRRHNWTLFSNNADTEVLEKLQSYAIGYQSQMYKNLKSIVK